MSGNEEIRRALNNAGKAAAVALDPLRSLGPAIERAVAELAKMVPPIGKAYADQSTEARRVRDDVRRGYRAKERTRADIWVTRP